MPAGDASRWYVCSGAVEFCAFASALALGACATSVVWASSSQALCDELRFSSSDAGVDVLVGEGVAEGDALGAACSLAGLHRGRTVLCVQGAADVAQGCAAAGVTAVVEPAGLVRLLVALHAEGLRAQAASGRGPEGAAGSGGMAGARAASAGRAAPAGQTTPAARIEAMRQEGAPLAAALAAQAADGARVEVSETLPPSPRRAVDSLADGATMPASRQLRSQGGVSLHDCEGRSAAPIELESLAEPVVLVPVAHLSQQVECGVAGMDAPVPTVCVASARGGVGKSALAVVAALALARHGLNVALIDLDFQFGTCLGYLGSGETDGLIDAGSVGKKVSVDARTLARCRCTPCRGLAAYEFCRMPEQAELLFGAAAQLVRAARAGSDVAVVDLPAGVSETVAQAIELADRCLFVADQGALSLESLSAQQSLCARLGIPRTKLVTVMNRCDPRHRDEGFLSRVSFEIQAPQVARVLDGGAEVTQMLSIGHAADLFGIQNKFATSVEALMAQVFGSLGVQGLEGAHTPDEVAGTRPSAKVAKAAKRRRKSEQEELPCPF